MDGLGQLIFILVIIVFSVVDAISRNQKKKQRMEEMEREEGVEGSSRPLPTPQGRARERRDERREMRREANRESEHRRVESAPARTVGGEPLGEQEEPEERVTADTLVPEDLWAILTGQTPPSRERQGPSEAPGSGPESTPRRESAPHSRPSEPEPTPSGEEASTRRSDRWMTGVGGREDSDRWGAGLEAEIEGAPSIYADEAKVYATIDDSIWSRMEDISSGELGDGRGRVQGEEGEEPLRRRRGFGGRNTSRYLEPIASGGLEGLRSAVVLRELGASFFFKRHPHCVAKTPLPAGK